MYVSDNPTTYADLYGNFFWIPVIAVGLGVAFVGNLLAPQPAFAPKSDKNLQEMIDKERKKSQPQNWVDATTDFVPGVYAGKCALGVRTYCDASGVGLSVGGPPAANGAARGGAAAYRELQAIKAATDLAKRGADDSVRRILYSDPNKYKHVFLDHDMSSVLARYGKGKAAEEALIRRVYDAYSRTGAPWNGNRVDVIIDGVTFQVQGMNVNGLNIVSDFFLKR